MFEQKFNKLAPYNQSSFLQNSADIYCSYSEHLARLTEQTHVLWSLEDCKNQPN